MLDELFEMLERTDPEWVQVLHQMTRIHDAKQKDYGGDEDPYANIASAQDLGIPPYVSATIRMRDKEKRISKAIRTGVPPTNDSTDDDMLDSAVYGVIRLILWGRERNA